MPISSIVAVDNNNKNYTRGLSFKSTTLLSNKAIPAYKALDVNSADFIKYIYQKFKKICNEVVEINVETGKLQDIVNTDEPRIFIMNHTKAQTRDINAAKFFNTLLYREYLYQSKAETCPRSKVMASVGMLSRTRDKGEEYKWMGAVPVYTGIEGKDAKNKNALTIKQLTKDLIEGKINLFLFPEGGLAILNFLPLKYKFQAGVSAIIKKVLEVKNHIRVTPLGIAHNKNESAIHIGDEIVFTKSNDKFYASRGNVHSKSFDKKLAKLYGENENLLITEKGEAVNSENIVPYLSGILMKNLECCTKEAKADLKNSSGEVYKL